MAKFIQITNLSDGTTTEYTGLNDIAKRAPFRRDAVKDVLTGGPGIPGFLFEYVDRPAEKRAYIKKAKNVKIFIDPELLFKVEETAAEEGIHVNGALTALLEEAIIQHYATAPLKSIAA